MDQQNHQAQDVWALNIGVVQYSIEVFNTVLFQVMWTDDKNSKKGCFHDFMNDL